MARRKTKKRFPVLRFMMKFVVAVLVLIGIALVGLFLMPAEKIAAIAAQRFEAMTGRAMVLEGDVRPSLLPQFGIKTGHVSIANADWSDAGPMLQADSFAVGVDLRALISGDIRITEVRAIAPKILLEIAPDGQRNWDFGSSKPRAAGDGSGGGTKTAPAPAATETASTRAISLDVVEITGGQVGFTDHRSGASYAVSDLDAEISLPDFAGQAAVKASGTMNGQPIAVDTKIAEFAAFLSEGAVPVTLAADIGGSKLGFDGRAGLVPVAAAGAMTADIGDMAGLFAALDMARPDLPAGLGRNKAKVTGDLTYAENRISLRSGTIELDQNRLVGALDLGLAGKPSVTAKLQTGFLDLSALGGAAPASGNKKAASGGGDGGSGDVIQRADKPAKSGKGWSKTPIDVSALGLVDADVLIEADKVALGPTELGRTTIQTTLKDSRAQIDIRELQAYEGAVSGTLVANGRGGLSVSGDLAGRSIALKPLLSQLAGYDRLIGAGQMTVQAEGAGASMDAIMNSLNGKGSFKIGAGELFGLDLVGMLRNLDASYVGEGAKTIFDEITGTFRIKNGILINDDLSLLSPLLTTTGSGKVGLGGQTLDYRLVPTLLAGEGKAITVPLLITGSWANPKFQLDIEALAGDKIDKAKAEAQQEVLDAVQKKVQDELGVDLGLGSDSNTKTDKTGKTDKKTKKKDKKADPQQQLQDAATEELLKLLVPN
jgi:AsmA protein